jgi:hypothetical protein
MALLRSVRPGLHPIRYAPGATSAWGRTTHLFFERVDGGVKPGQLTFETNAPMGQQAEFALLVAAPVVLA